jgi:hypothetical protein
MTAGAVDATLGELLFPSQVNAFLSCPAKWYVLYAIDLRGPRGTLALGTAFHSVLAANFRQKIETKQDLPSDELEESFGEVSSFERPRNERRRCR